MGRFSKIWRFHICHLVRIQHSFTYSGTITNERYISLHLSKQPGINQDVVVVKKPIAISDNILSTDELRKVEQSIMNKTEKGVVVVAGCSHSGVENILKAVSQSGKPYALIGELRGFSDFDLDKELILICSTNCTQHISGRKSLYPENILVVEQVR